MVLSRFRCSPVGVAICLFVASSWQCLLAQQVFIGGNPQDWNMQELHDALMDIPPYHDTFEAPSDVQAFIDVMADYASEGYVPNNLQGLSFKRVPMINEVVISNTVQLIDADTGDSGAYLFIRSYVNIETWYPFEEPTNMPPFEIRIGEEGVFMSQLIPPYPGLQDNFTLVGATQAAITPGHTGYGLDGEYRVTTFTYEAHTHVNCPSCPELFHLLAIELQIANPIEVILDGQVVDQVIANWPSTAFRFLGNISGAIDSGMEIPLGHAVSMSANDPRINWDPVQRWMQTMPTLGEMNATVHGLHWPEIHLPMRCAQRPFESITELTNLIYRVDLPWQTISIDPEEWWNHLHIVDRLTVTPDSHGTAYSWLIEHGFTNNIDTVEKTEGLNNRPLWESYIAGLNPLDPDSDFSVGRLEDGWFIFETMPYRTYTVYYTPSLIDPVWLPTNLRDYHTGMHGGSVSFPIQLLIHGNYMPSEIQQFYFMLGVSQ